MLLADDRPGVVSIGKDRAASEIGEELGVGRQESGVGYNGYNKFRIPNY